MVIESESQEFHLPHRSDCSPRDHVDCGTDHAVNMAGTVAHTALHCAVPLHRLWLIGRRQSVLGPFGFHLPPKSRGGSSQQHFPDKAKSHRTQPSQPCGAAFSVVRRIICIFLIPLHLCFLRLFPPLSSRISLGVYTRQIRQNG